MPVLGDPQLTSSMFDILKRRLENIRYDCILGIESRGFLIGQSLALKVEKPFVPIRKKGKLPGDVYQVQYELEYGSDVLEVQKHSLLSDNRYLIVDDLIATGGSMEAAKKLVLLGGCQIAGFAGIIELKALKGRDKLGSHPIITLFEY